MKILNTTQPTDPDQVGSLAAIKRAALRARDLTRQNEYSVLCNAKWLDSECFERKFAR